MLPRNFAISLYAESISNTFLWYVTSIYRYYLICPDFVQQFSHTQADILSISMQYCGSYFLSAFDVDWPTAGPVNAIRPCHFSPHLIQYSLHKGFVWFLARNKEVASVENNTVVNRDKNYICEEFYTRTFITSINFCF